jgi:2-polyprenyl-6-methoxyphenol hydroxylase-like FAD-dependent oxidoreductase
MRTSIRGSSVAVVGGSIAGCAAAVALSRVGCSVTVYERSRDGLRDRGAGITIPVSVREDLVAAGYLDPRMPTRFRAELIWVTRDGSSPAGRLVGRQPYPSMIASWQLLWHDLRGRLPAGSYQAGSPVTAIRPVSDGVTLEIDGSRFERFDAVIGADGHRSGARRIVAPEARIDHAGYGLWRGDLPVERLSGIARSPLTTEFVAVGGSGVHGVFYLIPESAPGRLRQNWGVYGPVPDLLFPGEAMTLPRGSVGEDAAGYLHRLIAERFPSSWAEVIRQTRLDEMSVSPLYDANVSAYVSGRLLLIGDAGALARPHTGAGAVKALQDARALERACRENRTWEEALAVYDAERCAEGNALTELGKHLGRMRVEAVPDWSAMTPGRFAEWISANTDGWRSGYDLISDPRS